MKLHIEIGNYVVTGTSHDLVLSEKRIVKDGPNAGKETLARLGYYSRFEHLVKELCHREILESESQTLTELVSQIDAVSKECHRAITEYLERENVH